ncbi:MAG TPA: UbiX family flavin prenyltransferase [Pseudonocardiaceae bacterium]|nr:UbiX family flavin prenyltransferase [Pseudonocardiaceae bacterium]
MAGPTDHRRRVVVAITGASGTALGLRMLEILAEQPDIEVHLIVSKAGMVTLRHECGVTAAQVKALADVYHRASAVGDSIASGSYPVDAMLVAPCTVKTLSAIAVGYTDELISRAADVCLKEGRPLLLMVRETPLHLGHLRSMTAVAEMGGIIAPPVPAFYPLPKTVDDLIEHSARRALARVGLTELAPPPWDGELEVGHGA